jgi:hypothetical protein
MVGAATTEGAVGAGVGALPVTRGVTAGVGRTVGAGGVVGATARTGGSVRPAFKKARAATAPISASKKRLLMICHRVIRNRPPVETNGRPHQSHSVPPG